MGKASGTSPKKCREIQTLSIHSKHSQRDTATIAGGPKSVVNRIKIKQDQNKPLVAGRVGKCGRKRITSSTTDRKISDICLENYKTSVAPLTTMINDEGIAVSKRTVRRRLAEENLISRWPIKKPHLVEPKKKSNCHRPNTGTEYASPTNQHSRFWSIKVYSSDDALENSSIQTIMWRGLNTWLVLSCDFSQGHETPIYRRRDNEKDQYKRILDTGLFSQLRKWFPGDECIFIHDSAPCHKARSVTAFLVEKKLPVALAGELT